MAPNVISTHPLTAPNGEAPLTVADVCEALSPYPASAPLRLLLHRIHAGFPSPAADDIEEGLDLNDYLVRNRDASFLFTVQGESMVGAGIVDGDKVVVDRSIEARHSHIVIAAVDGEFTIKRLFKCGPRVELRAENPAFAPIRFADGCQLEIWGVVVGVVRRCLA